MTKEWSESYKSKLIHPNDLEETIFALKKEGLTIATLNGSFDLLHSGHLHIIYEASKQADILIVALNSDSSIKQYKNVDRPIIPLQERIKMMAAIGFVTFVTWFDEIDPCVLLKKIKPHVHVNGILYGENCIEAETVRAGGGRLHLVSLVPGLSTSEIVSKIHQLPQEAK